MTVLLDFFGSGEEGLNNVKSFLESFRGNPLHDMKEAILFSSLKIWIQYTIDLVVQLQIS
jgi:hypothetical protein